MHKSQHSGAITGGMQEAPGPESPHSAWNLQETQAQTHTEQQKWLQAYKEKVWLQFDKDANAIFEAKCQAD